MLLRNLVVEPADKVFLVRLYSDSNFEMETSILGDSFTITVRTYKDFYSYFTIKLNQKDLLCVSTLARLGVNFCYAPITTIDNKRHVFYLHSQDPTVTRVHHSLLGNKIQMYYYQEKIEDSLVSLIV